MWTVKVNTLAQVRVINDISSTLYCYIWTCTTEYISGLAEEYNGKQLGAFFTSSLDPH